MAKMARGTWLRSNQMIFNPIEPILTLLRREERGAERYPKDLPKANTSKINNCIAKKSQSFLLETMKDEYERQKKEFILEQKS